VSGEDAKGPAIDARDGSPSSRHTRARPYTSLRICVSAYSPCLSYLEIWIISQRIGAGRSIALDGYGVNEFADALSPSQRHDGFDAYATYPIAQRPRAHDAFKDGVQRTQSVMITRTLYPFAYMYVSDSRLSPVPVYSRSSLRTGL
jgi:hypothetical protein